MSKRIIKRALALVLSVAMVFSFNAFDSGKDVKAEQTIKLEKGTYEPGDAIVMIENKKIDKENASLKSVKKDDQIGSDFGDIMNSTYDSKDIAKEASSLVDIIGESLDDFVIEDSAIIDKYTFALVHSDSISTKSLITKLSSNDNIYKAEANYKLEMQSYTPYEADDFLSSTAYHANSSLAENTGGRAVDNRGVDDEKVNSINASTGWAQINPSGPENVVAVIDSGVRATHEDLKDMMWTNPGNIGLKGTHGYCFGINEDDPTFDPVGHGTHCAGIIGAEANNGKGTLGVGSKSNVKIMGISIEGKYDEGFEPPLYSYVGAFYYIAKAKEAGVNIVATNCSWSQGSPSSYIFDSLIDLIGEKGVLTCIAAGNDHINSDFKTDPPVSTASDYAVVVGCGTNDIDTPAGFSNYGKQTVDLFAPGFNIVSSVASPTYFPDMYENDAINDSTDYYGEFRKDTVITDNNVTPEVKAGTTTKQFGESFFKQQISEMDKHEVDHLDPATSTLSIDPTTYISNSENAASLKWTLKDAEGGGSYFLCFPYDKDPATTGADNTRFSCMFQFGDIPKGLNARVEVADIVEQDDGTLVPAGQGKSMGGSSIDNVKMARHIYTDTSNEQDMDYIYPADDVEGKNVGLGIIITPVTEKWKIGEKHDITLSIDSLAMSKPDIELDADSAYDVYSGTSMASPACAGAVATICAMNPKEESQSQADYVKEIKSILLTSVKKSDALEDMCGTSGNLDLNNVSPSKPSLIDARVNVDKKTITLTGRNMKDGVSLKYQRAAKEGSAPTTIPVTKSDNDMYVEFAVDGKTATIYNATSLINTYTEFFVTKANGEEGKGTYFLVKGEKKPTLIDSESVVMNSADQYPDYQLVSNALGTELFAIDKSEKSISKLIDNKLTKVYKKSVATAFKDYLIEKEGDTYSIYNDYNIGPILNCDTFCINGELFDFIAALPYDDEKPTRVFLANMNLNAKDLKWTFKEIDDGDAFTNTLNSIDDGVIIDGKIYMLKSYYDEVTSFVSYKELLSFDIDHLSLTRVGRFDCTDRQLHLFTSHDKLYAVFGSYTPEGETNEEIGQNVYCYDNNQWTIQDVKLPYIGKPSTFYELRNIEFNYAHTLNGVLMVGNTLDGYGNIYVFDAEKNTVVPTNFTTDDGIADNLRRSAVATKAGIYYIQENVGTQTKGYELYLIPADSGAYDSIFPIDPKPTPPSPTPSVTKPGKAKISKIAKRKKSAKKMKITLKKVKGAKGYQVAVYKTKKNAKKNKKALIKKYIKKVKYTIKSKKFKNKKTLYVKARAYKLDGKKKVFGAWSKIKKSKAK